MFPYFFRSQKKTFCRLKIQFNATLKQVAKMVHLKVLFVFSLLQYLKISLLNFQYCEQNVIILSNVSLLFVESGTGEYLIPLSPETVFSSIKWRLLRKLKKDLGFSMVCSFCCRGRLSRPGLFRNSHRTSTIDV